MGFQESLERRRRRGSIKKGALGSILLLDLFKKVLGREGN